MGSKTILVVEDEPKAAAILRSRLTAAGFTVMTCATGKEALAGAAETAPDLVILDLKLPDMRGYDVAKELRKLCHPWALPILMLTAMDQPVDQVRGFAFGADAYLTKPYDLAELLETITLLLEGQAAMPGG